MRPLRYFITVTLDGCCDHRVGVPDEELHRHATETLLQADALLFGRVTYQMMEAAFRPAWTGERPEWMEPFRRTIDAARKYVVSSTPDRVDWNTARGTAQGRRASRARCAVRSRRRRSINGPSRTGLSSCAAIGQWQCSN